MTAVATSSPPAEFQSIAARLDDAGNKFRLAHVMGALAKFLAFTIPFTFALILLAGLIQLPLWVNSALLVAIFGGMILAYVRLIHPLLFQRPSYAQIARWVEENASQAKLKLDNRLINAVLLSEEYQLDSVAMAERRAAGRNTPWIPHVLREIDGRIAGIDFAAAVPWRQQYRLWMRTGITAAVVLLLAVLFHTSLARGLAVLTSPTRFVPQQGRVKILDVQPGNDTVLAGQSETFIVHVESPDKKSVDAKIELTFASGKHVSFPMASPGSDIGEYKYTLATVAEDVDYVIVAGDSQSERYHLSVLPQINLLTFTVEVVPPVYTGMETKRLNIAGKDLTAAKGSIEVPLGSTVNLTAALDMPVKGGFVDVVGGKPVDMLATADGKSYTASLMVRDSLKYNILLNDANNRTLKRIPDATAADAASSYLTITAMPDAPPTIMVNEPARDLDAKPGDSIPMSVTASDDYGLKEIRLEVASSGSDAASKDSDFTMAEHWNVTAGADKKPVKTYQIKYLFPLPAGKYKLGDSVRYRFVAVDNRNLTNTSAEFTPQTTTGQVYSINLNDTAAAAAKSNALWDELRKKLQALLDQQVKLRQESNKLAPSLALAEAKRIAGGIGEGQKSLRADMASVAKDFPFETSMKLIQKTLLVLVTEDATGAIDRTADLQSLSDTKVMTPIATKLRRHQSRIIDVLESLLAIATSEQKSNASVIAKEGGDLPNDAKEAWKKLLDDLKKFKDDQKAVIDSTADLAKKPKDQFDKADLDKIAKAEAAEDKWEKFMNQAMVDMSKIAEQDQANASLLDELVQMKIELAMAKDALKSKATEIAVPLEESGLENAKELTTHIERWLEHAPDRSQWQMEEPVHQNDAPMAELPKQLQDMMGDLMDQEEDETEKMEDMGSKWADSIDKGAGWGALDGPISNMSAQGVTGNQLPNNDEIQGRSGEGREGRASGEMVGNEAEGKGGRRTPTRMTPEPFSPGKVNDKSKEPAGGATGGGKRAGWGGEGLEGPAPEEMHDHMQRLAGKQAELHNEAERLKLQMHAQGFNNFKLLEAAVLMQKADDALKSYRYETALRFQKEAVQSLNTAKVLAGGQMHVTLDTSPTMSEKTQKDIEDALHSPMPKGYADPVKAYFQKLSTDPQ